MEVQVIDFNGDGKLDVVTNHDVDRSLYFLAAAGGGGLGEPQLL